MVTETITPLLTGTPSTTTFGYDLSGNTTAITNTGVVTSLTYNAAGRLATASLPDGRSVGIGYNAAGLRATLAVTPTGGTQPSLTEAFLYRGGRVGQVVVSGTPVSAFTLTTPFTETFLYRPDGAPLELLLQQPNQATQRYYYALDGQGNVAALLDGVGNVVNTYQYTPWGALIPPGVHETIPQPLRFKGYWDDSWYDGPLPWYWLTARYYDPQLERFLQPDPSAQDGVRSYVYCHDQPVDCTDPSGLAGAEGGASGAGSTDGGDLSGSGLTLGPGGEIVAAAPDAVLPASVPSDALADIVQESLQSDAQLTSNEQADTQKSADPLAALRDAIARSSVKPRNYKYRGETYRFDSDNLAPETQAALRDQYPTGVPFSDLGFPNFSEYVYVAEDGRRAEARIAMTGKDSTDFLQADTSMDWTMRTRPIGWTWHHVEDLTTMQLVPTLLHDKVGHSGARWIIDKLGLQP